MEKREIEEEELWQILLKHEGETFYTKKGLPFTYEIRGNVCGQKGEIHYQKYLWEGIPQGLSGRYLRS